MPGLTGEAEWATMLHAVAQCCDPNEFAKRSQDRHAHPDLRFPSAPLPPVPPDPHTWLKHDASGCQEPCPMQQDRRNPAGSQQGAVRPRRL